jgi:hypothetical protein
MKPRFRKNRLWKKALCFFLAVAFVSLTSSCSHPPHKARGQPDLRGSDSSAGETKAARAYSGEDPWWKKPEYEWLIATLIVIGVGIAAGAAIMISSGAGGLTVRVQK